jgi:hypothetical protein
MIISYEVQYLNPDYPLKADEPEWITANTDATTRVEALVLETEYVRNYPQTSWRVIMLETIPLPSSVYTPPSAWAEIAGEKIRLAS